MIQRIQTVYLFMAAALLGTMFAFTEIWAGSSAAEYSWFVPTMLGVFGLAAAGSIGSIFLFKDQARQRRVVVAIQIVTLLGLLVLFAAQYMTQSLPLVAAGSTAGQWAVLIGPVLAYGMFRLARRGIDKDIALIKSMDRLR